MNSNEGRWSIGLISIPSFGRSMCVPVGRPMSHESAGEMRIFQKRFLEPAFRPAKPGFIAQKGSHLRWPRDRMSYSSLRFGLG